MTDARAESIGSAGLDTATINTVKPEKVSTISFLIKNN